MNTKNLLEVKTCEMSNGNVITVRGQLSYRGINKEYNLDITPDLTDKIRYQSANYDIIENQLYNEILLNMLWNTKK